MGSKATWWRRQKQKALCFGVKTYVRWRHSEAIPMLNLSIDSEKNTVRVEALLAGETETVLFHLHGYRLEEEGDETFLAFDSITSSREWMTKAAQALLTDNRLPLPTGTVLSLLKTVI